MGRVSEREREREIAALGWRHLWGGSSFIRAVQSSHYSPVNMLLVPDQLNGRTVTSGPLPPAPAVPHVHSSAWCDYMYVTECTVRRRDSTKSRGIRKHGPTGWEGNACVCMREFWLLWKSRWELCQGGRDRHRPRVLQHTRACSPRHRDKQIHNCRDVASVTPVWVPMNETREWFYAFSFFEWQFAFLIAKWFFSLWSLGWLKAVPGSSTDYPLFKWYQTAAAAGYSGFFPDLSWGSPRCSHTRWDRCIIPPVSLNVITGSVPSWMGLKTLQKQP